MEFNTVSVDEQGHLKVNAISKDKLKKELFKPAFTSKKKTYISTPEAKIAAIRTAKDTAKSLGKTDYYNGLEAALAILQDRPAIQMQPAPKWFWFRTDRTGIRG